MLPVVKIVHLGAADDATHAGKVISLDTFCHLDYCK